MMSQRISSLLLFVFLIPFSVSSQTLSAPADTDKEFLNDVLSLVSKATGKQWKEGVQKNGSHISLQLKNDARFKTKESYQLISNGQQLTITSSSAEGLIFGLYQHLRSLGFRFYLPDEQYTLIPSLSNIAGPKKEIIQSPFLQVRNFFGTGGFGSGMSDPGRKVEKDWYRWKQRNGFGASYELGGHAGENFILTNYELLRKKPEWLAAPLTGDKHRDQLVKLNYLNKEAVEFFVNWSLQKFTAPGYTPPPANHIEYVSLEPADGGGYINEQPQHAGKNLPSISDQVYGAANLAAEKLDQLFPNHPNIRVNLYAYSTHAEPPGFPLHKRVFVQLIPYSFQSIAFGPSFIKLWKSKVKNFALYDYFRYPDVQYDLPGGITLDEVMKRLLHSVRNGSEGTHFESSTSKFATGIPLYIMARYMAEGKSDHQFQLGQLTKDLYGKAAPKMAALFQLFYQTPDFGVSHLGNAVQLASEAYQLADNNTVRQRIDEIKLYLNYANLVFASRNSGNGPLYQRMLPVAEYAWKLYPSKILHSYRIMQLVSYSFLNQPSSDKDYALYQQLHHQWFPETERSRAAWNKIPQNADNADQQFRQLVKTIPASTLSTPFTIADVLSKAAQQNMKPRQKVVFAGGDLSRGYLGIYAPRQGVIELNYQLNAKNPALRISSIDAGYLKDTVITLSQKRGTIRIPIASGETTLFFNASNGTEYRIEAKIQEGLFFYDGSPRGKLAFYRDLQSPDNQYTYEPGFYPSYFFVPAGTKKINYQVQLNMLSLSNPSGKTIASTLLSSEHGGVENREFAVEPSHSGKLWKAEIGGNFNYQLQNIPDRYYLLEKK